MAAYVQTTSRWDWLRVEIDGDDLVVRGVKATWFGSASDDQDNGIGCKGWQTAKHPDVPVVALPFRVPLHAQFKDSPIPAVPVKSPTKPGVSVRVFAPSTGKVATGECADLGPSLYIRKMSGYRYLNHGIDLSEAMLKQLGLDPEDGVYTVDYRIIGGAKLLTPDMRPKS